MYLMGGRDRCIGRYIGPILHRSILDRVSVDTRSSIGRYIGRVSTDVSTDTAIYRLKYLVAHRDFTDTSPILHRCFTDTLPSPSVLVDIGGYIS